MRCKWHFGNEVPQSNKVISQFKFKWQWNRPKGHSFFRSFFKQNRKGHFVFDTRKGEGLQFN